MAPSYSAYLQRQRRRRQKLESRNARVEDGRMTEAADAPTATDLDHVRRSRRLLGILVDRFGVAHFLAAQRGRVSARACEDAVALACAWIERRTGRAVADDVVRMMRKDLRRLLTRRIREGAACTK
jgi:hypothetical protein